MWFTTTCSLLGIWQMIFEFSVINPPCFFMKNNPHKYTRFGIITNYWKHIQFMRLFHLVDRFSKRSIILTSRKLVYQSYLHWGFFLFFFFCIIFLGEGCFVLFIINFFSSKIECINNPFVGLIYYKSIKLQYFIS